MTSTNDKEAAVLEEVSGMIREVVGEEWTEDTVITMDTTFTFDLEVESIELVALASGEVRHQRQLPFVACGQGA